MWITYLEIPISCLLNLSYTLLAFLVTFTSLFPCEYLLHSSVIELKSSVQSTSYAFLPRNATSSVALAVMRCLCDRLLVTFVDCVKTNRYIFTIFSPSGSQTILVFPYQTAWQYSDGNLPNGASNAGGVGRNRDSEPNLASLRAVNRPSGKYSVQYT